MGSSGKSSASECHEKHSPFAKQIRQEVYRTWLVAMLRSRGRGTKSKPDAPDTSVKELWVYPLTERLKEKLLAR